MSNPQNPLSKFQTYAYHQFLVVCDSTETAERLASPAADLSLFDRQDDGSRFQPQFLDPNQQPTSDDQGDYVVLISGYSDAQFVITKASWTSLLAPQQESQGGSELASMELDGEIEIIEPRGARFMKLVTDAASSLNRDPVGLTWLLRTIFVGQLPNGQTRTISNVKGVTFVVTDIEAKFDEAGAVYAMKFIGTVNGVGHLPAVQAIARGPSLPITKDMNVFTALKNYETLLNDHWLNEKKKLQDQVSEKNAALQLSNRGDEALDIDFDRDFAQVVYKIEPDDREDASFKNFKVGTNEQIASQNKGLEDPVIAPGELISVEGMIKRILDSSKDINDLSKGTKDKDKKKLMYKIVSGLTSTPDEYTITYFVKLVEVPTTPFQDLFGKKLEPAPGQFIEFDYIFTGKNTDILDFDINMQMGLAFLQVISTTNNNPNMPEYLNQEIGNSTQPGVGGVQRATSEPKRRTKTPLFLGMKLTDPIFRHKKNPGDTVSFQTLFSRWAGLENLEAKVRIVGNSQLLSDTTALPSDLREESTTPPRDVRLSGEGVDAVSAQRAEQTSQESVKQQARRSEESTVAPTWITRPVLMKLNIKFPKRNDAEGATESFWWDGFYYLFQITHTFDDGLFTQDLQMFSIIEDDGFFGEADDTDALGTAAAGNLAAGQAGGETGLGLQAPGGPGGGVGISEPVEIRDLPSFQPSIDRFKAIREFGQTEEAAEQARLDGIRKRRVENTIFPTGGGA